VSRHDSCSLVPKMGEMPFRSNLEALPIGVIVTDLSGRLVGCNHQAQALLEIPADAIGRQLRDVGMAPGVPDLASEIPQVPTSPGVRHLPETRVQRRGADAAIVRLLLTPAVDADGTPSGVIIAAEDCTRRRELEAMRHVDDYRHEFLAMLAHELRNPLSPIASALSIIRRRASADETVQQARAVVERQVQHEARLLDDLLDVSRITTGKVELRKNRLDLADAVGQALDSARGLIDARRHTVTRSDAEAPLHVDADPVRLEQVIVNLLNNAAIYTPPRGHIGITLARDGEHAVLSVRDTGQGIPPEMLPHVFELFTQFHASIDRSLGGLGVGLAVVKRLIERHDGTVTAASDGVGRGSTFTVRLPLAGAPLAVGATPEVSNEETRRVLIIEDNLDAREMLRTVLEMDGHEVELADNGLGGVQIGLATRPDVVLVDIGLPGIDGYEVARRLRRHLGDDVRLIALTG